MTDLIEIRGLKEILARFGNFPQKYEQIARATMEATLLHMQGSVPPYPPAPAGSRYRRTGMLGRSLGVSTSAGPIGRADVQEVKIGSGLVEGTFGTRLNYAPRVIGSDSQQAPWSGYWWTMRTVAGRAREGIIRLWQRAGDTLAHYLDGK